VRERAPVNLTPAAQFVEETSVAARPVILAGDGSNLTSYAPVLVKGEGTYSLDKLPRLLSFRVGQPVASLRACLSPRRARAQILNDPVTGAGDKTLQLQLDVESERCALRCLRLRILLLLLLLLPLLLLPLLR
jgi:hypothetical protein